MFLPVGECNRMDFHKIFQSPEETGCRILAAAEDDQCFIPFHIFLDYIVDIVSWYLVMRRLNVEHPERIVGDAVIERIHSFVFFQTAYNDICDRKNQNLV